MSAAARVVSLVPSATETLLAWGVTPVGVTRFCDAPGVRRVGGTKDPDVGAVAALAPDLVVLDREENRREDADALRAAGLDLHVLHVVDVAGLGPAMRDLAAALGVAAPAGDLPAGAAPVVARAWVPIWQRPWMCLGPGTYAASLLGAAGVEVVAAAGGRYPAAELADAAALGADVVLAPSEPYPFRARHVAELSAVAPVELVDGRDLFWWGARTPAALSRLRELAARLASAPASPRGSPAR